MQTIFQKQTSLEPSTYETIIVGAGIGGLICGCYLAKEGKKILIVEQHDKPGGYCTSFKRSGFSFDVAIHYFGSGRKDGELGRIINEFSLNDYLTMKRIDPCDKIILPNQTVYVYRDPKETVKGLIVSFPLEGENIEKFFSNIESPKFLSFYGDIKKKTFGQLLRENFSDKELIAVFEILAGNLGLTIDNLAAVTGVTLFKEYILDGGYYPKGGAQSFADALAKRFMDYGGRLELNNKVCKIISNENKVKAILLKDGRKFNSGIVVSNIDASETFKNLLETKRADRIEKIDGLEITPSAFVIYLGLDFDIREVVQDECAVWFFSTYDINDCFDNYDDNITRENMNYCVCFFPSLHDSTLAPKGKSNMQIYVWAPFRDIKFWKSNKEILADKLIKKAEEIVPNLSKHIEVKVIGTPQTFRRYTSNSGGAMYGWASTPDQIDYNVFSKKTEISGLYLTGHWTTSGLGQGGITSVIYSGRRVAKQVLRRLR